MHGQTGEAFESTQWTLLDALREGDESASREAGERLVSLYWPAVYGYLRRAGLGSEQAMEVTQAFFADVVLTRGLFKAADPARGRLRSLLLTALKRFRIDLARREKAHPDWNGPDLSRVRAVEARVSHDESPEHGFEREWALMVLEEARRRCEAHFLGNGRGAHWRAFEARHIAPIAAGATARPLHELAQEFGFQSDSALAAALQVVRKRFRALLEEVVAEHDTGDRASEIQRVLAVLSS